MRPLGICIGSAGCHISHKTHASNGLHLVPLSGGVLQLMVQLNKAGEIFEWNVVDLECDWKTAKPKSSACPVEIVDNKDLPEYNLRMFREKEMRLDLNFKHQPNKELRRKLKREYWDWAVSVFRAGLSAPTNKITCLNP